MVIRRINWRRDKEALRRINASFVTDRVYVFLRDGLSFSLIEEACNNAVAKRYHCTLTEVRINKSLIAIAACDKKEIRGYAVVESEDWNRRVVITDFFVDRYSQGRGVGTKMMQHILRLVQNSARVLWVETQGVNFPAIRFYRRMGFEVCGFDSTLYDGKEGKEVAIFLSKSFPRFRKVKRLAVVRS